MAQAAKNKKFASTASFGTSIRRVARVFPGKDGEDGGSPPSSGGDIATLPGLANWLGFQWSLIKGWELTGDHELASCGESDGELQTRRPSSLIRHTLTISLALNFVHFEIIWRYFGWANQTLAAVALWAGAVFLARRRRRWWIAFVPAVFMTVVTTTYILVEDVGVRMPHAWGTGLGLGVGGVAALAFLLVLPRLPLEEDRPAMVPHPSEMDRSTDSLGC